MKNLKEIEDFENIEDLKEWIENELPSDGEWWSDGADYFIDAAKLMLVNGIPANIVGRTLYELYTACLEEFGE